MIPADLHFNFFDGIYGVILAFFVPFIALALFNYRKVILAKFASRQVLEEILIPRSRINYWAKVIALSLILILAVLAWMEPQGNGHYPLGVKAPLKQEEQTLRRRVHDVIFLIDASASMGVKDTRTGVTRLDYSKEIVDEVISQLRGDNVALWAFTSQPLKLSPLTLDYLYVRLMLKQLEINEGNIPGTNFIKVLETLRKEYFSGLSSKWRTLIIFSDGGDELEKNELEAATKLVNDAAALNLHVYTVGLGTQQGGLVPGVLEQGKSVYSRLNSQLLVDLAKRGRGEYYVANDMNAVELAQNLLSKIEKEGGFEKVNRRQSELLGKEDLIYDLYFQIPLAAVILLLLFVIFFPDTRRKRAL
jgi:Ca-activated chloride channel family protein